MHQQHQQHQQQLKVMDDVLTALPLPSPTPPTPERRPDTPPSAMERAAQIVAGAEQQRRLSASLPDESLRGTVSVLRCELEAAHDQIAQLRAYVQQLDEQQTRLQHVDARLHADLRAVRD